MARKTGKTGTGGSQGEDPPGVGTTTPKTGFRNPPKHTQFRKGQCGNKKGRPQGSKNLSKEGVLKSTPAENGARAFVQFIESCIEGSLSPAVANVTPSDKADLERALSALRPSFDELAKCFFNPVREQKPAVCEHGYYMLWSLIGAAFVAGSSGTMSKSARSYASRANALKSPRSQKKTNRHTKLRSFLRRNYSDELVKKTRTFAEIIRPAFLKYLGMEEFRGSNDEGYNKKEPTIETIFQDLRAIKSLEGDAL